MRSLRRTFRERYLRDWRFAPGLKLCHQCSFDSYDTKLGKCRLCELSDQEAWALLAEDSYSATYPPPMAP